MSDAFTTLNPGSGGSNIDEESVTYGSAPTDRRRARVILAGAGIAEVVAVKNTEPTPSGTEYGVVARLTGKAAVKLYDSAGVELSVSDGVAIPVGTRGLIIAGTDGANTRFLGVNASGQAAIQNPSNLDVALSTRASQVTLASVLTQLDVALSTRASQTTLASVLVQLDVAMSTRASAATQTDGTQKAINRGGAKGATVAADITSTAEGADHQAQDVQIYHGGVAKDPTAIRALTSADVVTTTPATTTSGTVAGFTVSNVALQIEAANASRKYFCATNNGTTNLYFGQTSGVTASGAAMGLKLAPNGFLEDRGEKFGAGTIFAIGDTVVASQNLAAVERI